MSRTPTRASTLHHDAFRSTDTPFWLDDLYAHVQNDRIDDGIDLLFRNVDELLVAGEFERCDNLLQTIDVGRLDSNLLVGLLSITFPARAELHYRTRLVRRVEKRLQMLAPERAQRLLAGRR